MGSISVGGLVLAVGSPCTLSRAEPSRAEPSHSCARTPGGFLRQLVRPVGDAMGRARIARRERMSRPSTGSAHALTPGLRRPAGAASLIRFRLLRLPRLGASAAACLLAGAFALLLGAGAAQAQTAPTFQSAQVEWNYLTVTFNATLKGPTLTALHSLGRPDGRAFTVTVTASDASTRTLTGGCGLSGMGILSGRKVSVTLCGAVYQGETATVSYDKTMAADSSNVRAGERLKNADGTAEVASFTGQAVTNNSPDHDTSGIEDRPVFVPIGVSSASVTGSTLTMEFGGDLLDGSSMTAGSAFALSATFTPPNSAYRDCRNGCTIRGTGRAQISGNRATVKLDGAIPYAARLSLTYTKPSANPLRKSTGESYDSFQFDHVAARGGDRTAPVLLSASVFDGVQALPPECQELGVEGIDEGWVLLEFDELLDEKSVPEAKDFHVTVNGERLDVVYGGVWVFGSKVVLFMGSGMFAGDLVEVSYTRSGYRYWNHNGPLTDPYHNYVANFSGQAANNLESGPEVARAEADGTRLTVTFNETIDPCCKGRWRVKAGEGSSEQTITVRDAGTTVAGNSLTLALGTAVDAGQRVRLAYLGGSGAVAVRDLEGNTVAPFSEFEVTNDTAGPQFASAGVDGRTLTVTFDKTLDATSVPAPGDFHVTVGSARRNVAGGGVAVDGAAVRLTLASAASKADTVKVRYTRGANPLWSSGGSEVETFADQAVANTAAPALVGAQVDGETITLTFDEPLDRTSVPAPRDFFVVVGNDRRNVAAGGVAVSGATVRLTLSWPAAAGETVILRYSKYTNPLRDLDGNEVENFASTDHAVSNLTAPPDADTGGTGPAFQSAEVDGKTLTLTFDGTLDARSVPAPGDFYVTAGGIRRHLAAGGVAIDGATVTLTLGLAVEQGQTVTVRYKKGANPLRDPSRNEVAGFAHAGKAVTNVSPVVLSKFWSADLTVKQFPPSTRGCSFAGAVQGALCSTGLTDDTFTHAGTDYTVGALTLANGALDLALTAEIPQDWTLHVGDETFSVADATRSASNTQATWASSGLTWSVGDTVAVALAAPGRPEGINLPPGFLSATISGNKLTIQFDQPLNEDSAPSGKSFTVGTPPVPDTSAQGGPGRRARSSLSSGNGPGGAVSGTGTASVDGSSLTVTLSRPVPPGQKVTVSYTPPDVNPVQDLEGEEAEGFSRQPATSALPAPAVTAVAVVSDAGGDATYALGETIRVRITFNQAVKVDTTDGTPRLNIRMDPRWGTFPAVYESGGGSANLTFAYTVAEPNTAPPGIAVLANTLELNGGTIRSLSGTDAKLAHGGLGHDAKHKVNWRLAPSDVSAVAVVSNAGGDNTYALGETIRVRITFDGTVSVDTAGGTPRLKIRMDPRWGTFWATYESGGGTNALTFAYTVAEPNTSPPGIAVLANTLQANGGAIRLAATNANARLGHTGLGHNPAHKVNWRLSPPVATTPPGAPTGVTVSGESSTSLSVSWTAPADTGSSAIAGYELRWHAGASDPANASDWTETGDVGAGTTATIADLAADTAYRVQVRARGDGKGSWSSSGAGRTQAAGDTTPPVPKSATVNWRAVTITFDEDLVAVGAGAKLHYALTVTGGGVSQHPVRATASGKTVTMQLGQGAPARAGRSYTITYFGGGQLKDAAGNAVVSFGGLAATNLTQPRLSVADAKAHEGTDTAMDFAVTLDAAADEAVTVDYATADGTATAGADYTAASGTLTFAAGERSKTVSVAILDDALDEGKETFLLRLSNADGAVIEDGEATGTITNSDPLQKMWLSRFGRTVADHVTGAVSDRLSNPLTGAQVTVAGQRVDLAETQDEAWLGEALTSVARALGAPSGPAAGVDPGSGLPGSGATGSGPDQTTWPGTGLGAAETPTLASASARSVTGGELLPGSAFHLAMDGDGASPGLAAWGRVTAGRFDGEAPADSGNVRIDGDVMTGILGTDAEWGRVLAGVALSLSDGEGTFDQSGVDSGTVESTMTTVSPYARVTLGERLSAWGLAGIGTGDMTVVQAANAATGQPERVTRTDLSMRLAALGGRGALLTADQAGGFDLALRGDAFFVETESDAVAGEGATSAAASRVRLVLEGSRAFVVGDGVITPGLELGLRHDGGDAETGTGVELGGRVSWTGADSGLSMEASLRALVAHEDSGYEEWGASGSIRLDPGVAGRGLSFSLAPTWGTPSGGVDRLWSARDARGLAAAGGAFEPESRLEGELGYGIALPGSFLGTPNVGFTVANGVRDYRVGWRLTPAGAAGFEVNLDATRRESLSLDGADAAPVEHGVLLRGAVRW